MKSLVIYSTILFTIMLLFCSCSKTKKRNNDPQNLLFEDHLLPMVQVISEPRYYNILDRMKHYNIPGVSITTIKDGKIDLVKGYGYARKEDHIVVDQNTRFQVASISKSITGLTTIQLRDQCILDLDEDIRTYLKSWELPENDFTSKASITLRMLLNHTAGVSNFNASGYTTTERLPSLDETLNGIGNNPGFSMDTIPGTVYNYSNPGYSIVQKVLEDITGSPFADLAKENVLEPLGMIHSTFETILPNKNNIEYSYSYTTKGKVRKGYWHNTPRKTSAGLWTTPSDLAKMCIALQKSLTTEEGNISRGSANELMEGDKYGLGLDLRGKDDYFSFSHSGRIAGFFSYMVMYPYTGDGIIMTTNSDNGEDLFREILRGLCELNSWDIILPKKIKIIKIPSDTKNKYLGTYIGNKNHEIITVEIKKDGDHLIMSDLSNTTTYPLRALSNTKFIDITYGKYVEFIKEEKENFSVVWDDEYKFTKK
ncbi:serine hydrolase [Aquimarina sp. AU119]|uniref:serine hydrolase domain-containing protein n=1 Tax=Aquimarina sp. AU119 TaxID=2108528 RepID=UPI000D68683B|nr:serine hydrolase domain-containing protein [Aquimarina sp. AU119]